MLTKVKFQVARKYPMWVFKTTAFEPRTQQSNPEKDPRSPYREIVQKLFKSVHLNIVTKFEQFLSNFSEWGARIFIWIALLGSWFKYGHFEYPHWVLSSHLNFHFCQHTSNFQMAKHPAENLKFGIFLSDSYSIGLRA